MYTAHAYNIHSVHLCMPVSVNVRLCIICTLHRAFRHPPTQAISAVCAGQFFCAIFVYHTLTLC
jgi:hypothetical protein